MAQSAKNKVETAAVMVSAIEEIISQSEEIEKEAKLKITISVTCFNNDNLDETKSNKYELLITHKDNIILQNAIDITENSKMVLHGEMEVNYLNISELSDLIENPVLVLVLETITTLKGKKEGAKSSNAADKPGLAPLGYCNMNLFSLLNGAESIEETMVLQPLVTPTTIEITTWPNLPTIMMRAEIEKDENCHEEWLESLNMLTVTIENLVNVPSSVTADYDCTIFSVVPKQNEVFQEMTFLKGVAGINANVETVKKWGALCELEGRGNISPYPLSAQNPMNPQRIQLNIFSEEEVRLVEWNTFHRCFIDTNDTEILKQYITKNHCWPLEIYLLPKVTNVGKAKKKNVASDALPLHLMAFPNVARLLYPGETSARVATTVYEYNEEYMLWKGGMKSFILENVDNVAPIVPPKPTMEPPVKNASSFTLASPADPQCEEALDEEGRPIYLIMEIQLLKPLTKCKTIEEIYDDIHKLLPVREVDFVLEKAQSAKKKYHQCVKDSTTILNEEYAKFLKNSKLFPCKVAGDDEMSAFIRFLNSSGVYANLVGGLCESVSHMVDDNCKLGVAIESEDDFQCFISKAFIELVNEMHKALMFPKSKTFIPVIESKDLLYFAREEEALKHYKVAENLHLQRISLKKDTPQVWFDYAVFCLRTGCREESYVAICEVIQLDFHHQMGLLLCGILLMYKEQNAEAENFLLALMNLYPNFFEGYIASSLFYKKIGRHEAGDVTMEIAKNTISGCALCSCSNILCCCDRDEFMLQEEFLWYDRTIPKNKTYLRACALFIRLGLFEFAETILAEQLIEEGPSLLYDYLMATVHFFNGKYCEALKHLQQQVYEAVATFLISSMEGHCLLALENKEAADEAFRYTNLCFDRPNDIHLVYIRLGQFHLNTGNYEHAKKMFINCCNYSPTPNSWLGAGIAFLKMKRFDDCEKCLTEANFLNRHNALVWAYLAILNIHLKKLADFKKCYTMATKNGLTDEKLLSEIKELADELLPEESSGLNFNTFVF